MDFEAPASFISVSPRNGTNDHIDNVMEIMRRNWIKLVI